MTAYGYSRAEFLQLRLDDIQPQDEVRRLLADLNSTGLVLPHFGQWHHHTKDGRRAVVELTAHLVEFETRPVALIMARAIAGPTQSDAHHASDERYYAIFTQSLDGILFTAPDGRIFAANPAACRLFQRTEEEICRLGRDALVDMSSAGSAVAERQQTGRFRGELTVLRADGNSFPAYVSSMRFMDDSGQERAVLFFHDVSDRKQAEKAFQESQALFHSFMNNSPAAAYIKDDTGHYVYVNPLAAQVLGRDRREVLGKTDADLWPAEIASELQGNDAAVFDMGLVMQAEESTGLADDIHHWLTLKFPITLPGRRLLGGMSMEITERLKAEAALRESDHKRIKESLSLARTLSSALPLETRLQELCQTTVELIDCDRSSIFLRDGEYYRARFNYGNPADIAVAFPKFTVHQHYPIVAYAVESPGRVVIENDTLHSTLIDTELARQARILAIMVVALRDDTGSPIGFITAEYNERPGTFAETSSILLLGLASAAEMAVVTDRHAAARRQVEETLRQINSTLENRIAERTHDLVQVNASLLAEIAARQRAEDTVRLSEDRYRIISQSISDYAFSFQIVEDGSVSFDWLTESFTKVTGYPVEEVLGQRNPLNSYTHPDDLLSIEQTIQTLEPERPTTYEFRLRRKDGAVRWIRSYIQRVGNSPDTPIRIHGAAQDITDRKQAREEIERLNKTLEQNVSELLTLNQELESFSYSVSHDLRAPLRHIHGFVELLHKHLEATLDDRSRRYIAVLTKSAKRMGVLIDDLLAFSRTARTELHATRVNLTQLVTEVMRDFADETVTRQIVWDVEPLPEVYGDAALLRIVLSNLMGNAVKYTRPRSTAQITIGWTAAAGKECVCFVRDNGVGFDMHYVDKLFGVFQRLHRDDEFEGTGIGLATVRRIVHRLGGRVWAEGELDQGATFYFALLSAQKGIEG